MCLVTATLLSRSAMNVKFNSFRYTIHVLIGELYYVCLTSKMDCPSSAIWVESCSQIFLQRLRSIYKELPLADLPKNLINLAEDDLSKPLKKMIVSNKRDYITEENIWKYITKILKSSKQK